MVSASRSSHFRDIRIDFQERAKWLDDQIKTAEEQFDHALKRLEQEHGSTISRLRFELDNIKSVLEFEERRFNGLTS